MIVFWGFTLPSVVCHFQRFIPNKHRNKQSTVHGGKTQERTDNRLENLENYICGTIRYSCKWRLWSGCVFFTTLFSIYIFHFTSGSEIIWDLTYLLITWSRVVLEKLTGSQLAKKFPAFYGTRRFITAFTNTRHLSLSWASSIQSSPYSHMPLPDDPS